MCEGTASVGKMLFHFCALLCMTFILCDSIHHQYCIIGAGPGGLQMGYFLKQAGRNYIIFERGNSTATFFQTYPRHRKLISINKVKTGRVNGEFNMRYDWNSLLSDDDSLLFKRYTTDFYPQADLFVRYSKDYQEKLRLAVQFDSEIRNITRQSTTEKKRFTMQDQRGNEYSCSIVIVATGLSKPDLPLFEGWEYVTPYKNISIDPEDYVGKNVLILGRGNSGFETADAIYPKSNVVHMMGRSRPRLSWSTHYVGDVRGINSPLLDNYQLKSLDGLLEAPVQYVKLYKKDDRIHVVGPEPSSKGPNLWEIFPLRDGYDVVISCLGFSFDDKTLFSESTRPLRGPGRKKKYPLIKPDYEVSNIPDVHIAGSLAHSLDFRKSSGGFIHGFRYTVQALHRVLEYKYHGRKWPSIRLPFMQILNVLIRRINEAAAMYEMFGALGDVVIFRNETGEFDYLEDVPVRLLPQLPQATGHQEGSTLVVILDYGEDFSGPAQDTFRENRATDDVTNAHRSNFLHPILYFYDTLPTEMDFAQKKAKSPLPKPKRIHHVLEDFLINWTSESIHILPLRRFIENSLGLDLRNFPANDCLQTTLTVDHVPLSCQQTIFSTFRE